jgi:hypothetical protein
MAQAVVVAAAVVAAALALALALTVVLGAAAPRRHCLGWQMPCQQMRR